MYILNLCTYIFEYLGATVANRSKNTIIKNRPPPFTAEKIDGFYTCSKCSKSFARLDSLKQHYGIHVQDYALKCSMCELTFGWASTLRRHEAYINT